MHVLSDFNKLAMVVMLCSEVVQWSDGAAIDDREASTVEPKVM